MPKYSHYCFSLLASTLLLTSCDDDPVSTTDGTKAEGVACQNTNECKTGMSCYGDVCCFNCQSDDDCDVENYHCEDSVCLPGKATVCGNGILELGEDCDDGGRTAGDGCDANCKLEQGWRCVSQAPKTPHSVCNRTQGNCLGNFTGENCDQCKGNFTGNNCDKCEGDHFGKDCEPCSCIHGTCKDGIGGNGQCQCESGWEGDNCDQETICPTGFTGPDCDKCLPEYYGLNCKPCTCIHGECNDTMNGDGYCRNESCETGWDGINCNNCAEGYTGPNCVKITCINGILNTIAGNCSNCNKGWSGDNCDQCDDHFTGTNCNQCDDRFTGTNCDQCADSRFTGTNCDQCDDRFTGTNCDQCADSRFTGTNCDRCKSVGTNQMTDGECNIYKTVVINNKTWMAENLRYSKVNHYSAKNKSTNDATYGYLYTWANAKNACPDGWRLPTADDFMDLIEGSKYGSFVSTTAIQAKSWVSGATNSTGFSALPAGYRYYDGAFIDFGTLAFFWSSTPDDSGSAYDLVVGSSGAGVYNFYVDSAFSVRCLKD